jgi:hypothetical protein
MKKENLDDELKLLSPFLHAQKKQNEGFQVPKDYFDTLEDSVFKQIDATGGRRIQSEQPAASSWSVRLFRPRILMAAAAVLTLLFAAIWFFKPAAPTSSLAPYAHVEPSEEELERYLFDNIHEFEARQLASIPNEIAEVSEEHESTGTPSSSNKPELRPEDVESLLDDMSDEELEDLL